MVDTRAGVREGIRHVAFAGLARSVQQVHLHGGVVHGLFKHQLQDMLKSLGVCCVVKIADAIQAFCHQIVHAHADDKRLERDALGLKRPGHRTWIFVASFDAVGDEHNHVSARRFGKILRRQFQRAGDGGGALSPDSRQGLLDDEVVEAGKRNHQFGVVAVLLSWHVLGAVSVHPEPKLQFVALVQSLERFAQEPCGGLNLAVPAPKSVHAVRCVKPEQDSRGQRFFVGGHLTPSRT